MLVPHQGALDPAQLSTIDHRLVEASVAIRQEPPSRIDFLHSVLSQVGLPRSRTDARSFERRSGRVSIRLEAGTLFNGQEFVDQPLPYGAVPRLVMIHVSSEAVRTRCQIVEVGDSMRQFLLTLGMQSCGGGRGGYAALKRQIQALAACRLTFGMHERNRATTLDFKPIRRFDAWLHTDGSQRTLWPGSLELSDEFFDSLSAHAVPLDHRALVALRHSALALDIYAWLAHRLCRVNRPLGVKLSWSNLREQFGQEYTDHRNFKRKFKHALAQVRTVYPDAHLSLSIGGVTLFPSRAPLMTTKVTISPFR